MGALGITLRGAFFGLLLCHVMADDTAANRAHHGVVARVVASHAAHDRALHAARGVSAAGSYQSERGGGNGKTQAVIQFHIDCLLKNRFIRR
jgi:hypothetical protein